MGLARQEYRVTAADYLAGELTAEVRHEYVAGQVYAMVGTSREHNLAALNLTTALHAHLRGGPCRVFMSDMKVHLRLGREEAFYYPDIVVACDPGDRERYFVDRPQVIVEVLSPHTARTDRREKFLAYTRIDSLREYVLVEQERAEVTLYRRDREWADEVLAAGDVLALPSLGFELPLAEVYAGVWD